MTHAGILRWQDQIKLVMHPKDQIKLVMHPKDQIKLVMHLNQVDLICHKVNSFIIWNLSWTLKLKSMYMFAHSILLSCRMIFKFCAEHSSNMLCSVQNGCLKWIWAGSPPSGRNQGNHGKCEKNLPDMEKSWNSISWEKSWKSHGNSNSGKENLFRFALQCLYYHIGRDLIKISLDPNMHCSLAEICAMTLYWL